MIDFPVESRKSTLDILATLKIKSRMEIDAASASRSAIAVLVSKYETTIETTSLTEIEEESA